MSDEDEEAIVVCGFEATPAAFPDDMIGTCCDCGVGVRYRPHSPAGPRICLICFAERSKREPIKVYITKYTAEEVAALIRAELVDRKGQH